MFKFLIPLPGLYLGWGLGSNDAANVFGPQVNSEVIRYRTATILTAIFVIVGALFEGRKCFETVGGITNLVIWTAVVSALAAALTVNLMSYLKIPVSTSQAIIGAIIGVGLLRHTKIEYILLGKVFICWILTPLGAVVIAYLLYRFLAFVWQRRVKNLLAFNRIVRTSSIIIGCYAAYTLGANNVANTTGTFVGVVPGFSPFMATLLGGGSIALGALTYSRNVMYTVGKKITLLDPFSALIAVLAQAITLHIYAQIGVPVSSSQAVVGAVVGVGLVKGMKMVNKKTLTNIFAGWFFTLVGSGVVAYSLGWVVRPFM
ncbi:MAG: inorganic phosphate transporter [Firmicutes bacterium]|nr:inorganic phosphate transporter [Bacillota bacterium]